MPYGQVTTPSATLTHIHSTGVGQGGPLNVVNTRIGTLNPVAMVVAFG